METSIIMHPKTYSNFHLPCLKAINLRVFCSLIEIHFLLIMTFILSPSFRIWHKTDEQRKFNFTQSDPSDYNVNDGLCCFPGWNHTDVHLVCSKSIMRPEHIFHHMDTTSSSSND